MTYFKVTENGLIPFTEEETAQRDAEIAQGILDKQKNSIKDQINSLERQIQSERTVREHILDVNTTRLPSLQSQIETLRNQLIALG